MQTLLEDALLAARLGLAEHSMCYSPFSLMHALLILLQCAAGEAASELRSKLHIVDADLRALVGRLQQDKSIALASNIFDKGIEKINPQFVQKMKQEFGFVPERLLSAAQVNKWCSDNTHGKIQKIIDEVDFDTILLSAIYFKGTWAVQFAANQTVDHTFTPFAGEPKMVKMMQKKSKNFRFVETASAQIAELEYADSKLRARIILPKHAGKDAFVAALNKENLQARTKAMELRLKVPKFKIESQFDLGAFLKSLGVQKIFDSVDCTATLGDVMTVTRVIQKTFIQIDEVGTEAAAVTAVAMLRGCAMMPIVTEMTCDHPFWFVLEQENGEVIFISSFLE